MNRRTLATLAGVALLPYVAGAQSWGETQGSGIYRSAQVAVSDPYQRPGLFFLGRAERVLPPSFALSFPFGVAGIEFGPGNLVVELGPANDRRVYASSGRMASVISGRK